MSDAFIGEIRLVPYFRAYPPTGWMFCNGTTVNVQQYQELFSLIGTTYGGDGVTNFGLPNLNGRVLVDQGTGVTTPNTTPPGGPALTPRAMGQSGGSEMVALTDAMIPPHDHAFNASTGTNMSQEPGPTLVYGSNSNGTYKRYVSPVPTPAPTLVAMASTTITSVGAGLPHPNIMAGLGLRYIICVIGGLYPTRN
ncbi:MAG: tail fiber protein [Niveispirillum sp.]|nr:tail fiber protein [Niveispirillum sp.]